MAFLLYVVPTPPRAHAQLVPDGATNTLDNVTNSIIGNVTIGVGGSNTLLILTNNALLTNSGYSLIGATAAAHHNTVFLHGTNTRWLMTNWLVVGDEGSFNQLLITDGGTVASQEGFIGRTANSNQVTVTGPGSLWTNSVTLYIGDLGRGNQLVVSNGGVVAGGQFFAGYSGSGTTGARSNVVLVTGAGSLLTGTGITVGGTGSTSRLVVSDGGTVRNTVGYLGLFSSSTNNVALVMGTNSLWTNSSSLIVGYSGRRNHLVVSNGATVSASDVIVGLGLNSLGNRITVDGGTMRATNAGGTGALDIRRGTNILNAGLIVADNLLLTNSAGFFEFNGGTLNVGSATVTNGVPFIVGNGTSNAALDFTGGGTRTFANGLVINTNATVSFGAGTLNSAFTTNYGDQLFTVGNGTGNAVFNLTGNGTHSFPGALLIASNATLAGNGTIVGNVTNLGTIAPGASAGAIALSGSLTLVSGSQAAFEIGGTAPGGAHDLLSISGAAALDGQLDLSLIRSFYPASNAAFEILTFGSAGGLFANVTNGQRVATADGLGSFVITVGATNVVLSDYFSPDANTNGIPDYGDYLATLDSDGDGQNDYAEALAGTDPNDPTSVLAVTSIADSGNIVVQFRSVAGKTYRIEHSTGPGPWTIATTNVPSTGTNTTWIDDGSLTGGLPAGQRFYRVGLQ